ncbi:MAG: T9SS type A sorting domain-containing protein [Bacteroidetes bacterium]|nr:T9SS type A sorting domain-containing protein [Bacteroidota bacterium]
MKNELEIINFNSVNFNFTITDLNGKKLIASKNSLNRINIECLKSGLYNITFDLGNQVLSKRFIKLE